IFSILREVKEKNNTSIIITSQWYEQISGFANYVLVLRRGDIVGRFDEESANAGKIFKLATGLAT
ncbi:unnamed protein product, partial [marine sediment metagenome]